MIEWSRELWAKVLDQYKPYAVVCMVSGGKDSMAAYQVMKQLGGLTHILHGVTGTGVPQTTEFVREWAEGREEKYIEADAGSVYEDNVKRRGFFGTGPGGHAMAYHLLKHRPFAKCISREIRQRKHGRLILLINGARREESRNRSINFESPTKIDSDTGNTIWVNILNEWTKAQRDSFLEEVGAPINPVAQKLCRSAECMCGTMQSKGDREEASFYYPEWGKWLDALEAEVIAKHGWGWGEDRRRVARRAIGYQPLCVECG